VFTTTDCWVLFSIGFGNNGSTLKQIISAGDMLNHAIISKNELEIGLNKLFQNDYIIFDEDRFYTTEKAKIFYKKNKRASEGCITEWIRISEELVKQTVELGEINTIKLTDEDYKKALDVYYQAFNERLKRLESVPEETRKNLSFRVSQKIKETK
jgi:hypothetical protein